MSAPTEAYHRRRRAVPLAVCCCWSLTSVDPEVRFPEAGAADDEAERILITNIARCADRPLLLLAAPRASCSQPVPGKDRSALP
jgi:hypothetical protein